MGQVHDKYGADLLNLETKEGRNKGRKPMLTCNIDKLFRHRYTAK
jgi:hypothetical protein